MSNSSRSGNSPRTNGDGRKLPDYYKPDGDRATTQPSSRDEMIRKDDLIGTTVFFNNQRCTVMDRIQCGRDELYALESDKPMTAYNGRCPRCNGCHHRFNDFRKGFYAAVNNIHDHIEGEKQANERAKGPKPVKQLRIVKENLPPLGQPITGKSKGIQGDSNSCYMDATIFCMFAYSDVFDTLLYKSMRSPALQALQEVLRDNIVHVLREKTLGSVQRDALQHLRVQLSAATKDPSFEEVEKDPSEFLRVFETYFNYAPLQTIPPDQPPKTDRSNVTTNIIWEMFDANPQRLLWTTIAGIFRNSLTEIPAKLATIPPVLVLVAPRHARSQRSYRYIVPERQIVLDQNILQLVCRECKKTNHDIDTERDFYYCAQCRFKEQPASHTTDATIECYCEFCMKTIYHKESEPVANHTLTRVSDVKHKLNLFAVLCIETAHYVAFVKCQDRDTQQHQWLFFDSMSDRQLNENIPRVDTVPDFDQWIEKAERDGDGFFRDLDRRLEDARPMSRKFNESDMRQLRLFRDGAFFFYENANVNYH